MRNVATIVHRKEPVTRTAAAGIGCGSTPATAKRSAAMVTTTLASSSTTRGQSRAQSVRSTTFASGSSKVASSSKMPAAEIRQPPRPTGMLKL